MAQSRYRTLLLVLGLCLAMAATFFFGYRAGRTARRVHWKDEPVKAWMSVPFIAHTHHTREDVLFQAIHLPPNPRDQRPIRDIARTEKVPVAGLIRDLESAIANAEPANGGSTPGKAPR